MSVPPLRPYERIASSLRRSLFAKTAAWQDVSAEYSTPAAPSAFFKRPEPTPPASSQAIAPLLLLGTVALLGTAYAFSIPLRQALTYGMGMAAPPEPRREPAALASKDGSSGNSASRSVTVVFKQPAAAVPPAAKPVNKPVPVPEKLQADAASKLPAPVVVPAVKPPPPQPAQRVVTAAVAPIPASPFAKPALVLPAVPLKPSVAALPPSPTASAKTVVTPAAHSAARVPSAIFDTAPKLPVRVLAEADVAVAALPPQEAARTQGEAFFDCAQCPELVAVVATPEEGLVHLASTGKPQQRIRPFAIGAREVTFDEWDRCVDEGGCVKRPSDNGWGRGQRPVINVSFDDITNQYLPWLSRITKKRYRLPSEAEWETALRGGASGAAEFAYSFGNDATLLCEYGNASDTGGEAACQDGFTATAPVASFKPNALGLYDMHGNVWEWVSDCLRSGFSKDPAKNPEDCRFRVLRGGSWASAADALKTSERGWEKPAKEKNSIGFRIARSLP